MCIQIRRRSGVARRVLSRYLFEDDLTRLAIGDLRRIHDAGAVVGPDDNPVEQDKHGKREVEVKQRLRR